MILKFDKKEKVIKAKKSKIILPKSLWNTITNIKIDKKITDLSDIVIKIDQKLNNKKFIERAPSDIINQNIS